MHLHIVSTSPLSDAALGQCLNYLGEQAAILLIQDAVVAATDGHPWREKLVQLDDSHPLFVLADDLVARGLKERVSAPFQMIDYDRFVNLCLEFDAVQSW